MQDIRSVLDTVHQIQHGLSRSRTISDEEDLDRFTVRLGRCAGLMILILMLSGVPNVPSRDSVEQDSCLVLAS